MGEFLGKDFSVLKISPLINHLLQDENTEVKTEMVGNLAKAASFIGADIITSNLMSSLQSLAAESP